MSILRRLFYEFFYRFGSPPWDTNVSPPELLEFIAEHPQGRALDLGCGTGTNVITLAKAGWRATGVDFIPSAIRLAQAKARQAGVGAEFYASSVTSLSFITGTFDLVLDIGCLHSLSTKERGNYIVNLGHLLAPEGAYLLYTWVQSEGSGWSNGLTAADFQLLSASLSLESRVEGTERGHRPSAWLTYQKGTAQS